MGGPKYHHGDLPNALRAAAREVIVERGLGNFSLREVARRAGVSPSAPAHHFGDLRGLLTSLATEGFDGLAEALEGDLAAHDDVVEQIVALGTTYVRMAKQHPAHIAVMFRPDLIDGDDPALLAAGLRAYLPLETAVARLLAERNVDLPVDDVVTMLWASIQGLIVLEPKLDRLCEARSGESVPIEEMVRRFASMMLRGIDS